MSAIITVNDEDSSQTFRIISFRHFDGFETGISNFIFKKKRVQYINYKNKFKVNIKILQGLKAICRMFNSSMSMINV